MSPSSIDSNSGLGLSYTVMPDPDASEIHVFGKTYVADANIEVTHTLSQEQAARLARLYPECTRLQEAIRQATKEGADARERIDGVNQVARKIDELREDVNLGFQDVNESLDRVTTD